MTTHKTLIEEMASLRNPTDDLMVGVYNHAISDALEIIRRRQAAYHATIAEAVEAFSELTLKCYTRSAEDLEPGCCVSCRAKTALTKLRALKEEMGR